MRNGIRNLFLLMLFMRLLVLPGLVQADVAKQLSLEELTTAADVIVVAKCIEVESFWKNNKVFTRNLFEVQQSLVGEHSSITVNTLGGTAQHPLLKTPVTTHATDNFAFVTGEEFVLFLQRRDNGEFVVLGGIQGAIKIKLDPQTQSKVIDSFLKTPSVETNQSGKQLTFEEMSLVEFLDRINAVLSGKTVKEAE